MPQALARPKPRPEEGGEFDREDDGAADKDGGAPFSKEEIEEGDICEMARDKIKSRLLQRSLLRGGPDVSQLVYCKAEPHFMELTRDHYGNYLSQKILEVVTAEQFDGLFALIRNEILALAQDVHGTRAVQKVVEQATVRGRVAELVEALPPDSAEELSRSVTGFHVVSKLIELLPATEVDLYIERLCGTAEQALALGKDQWGCCVMKRCIDRSQDALHERIVKAITDNTLTLVQDPFGNYVVQHLILYQDTQKRLSPYVKDIIDAMKGRMFEFALLKFSSNVLEKCLVHSSDKDRNKIINEILNPPDHLPSEAVKMLIFHQYGNYVFQQALDGAKDPQFSLLVEHSKQLIHEVALETEPREQEPNNLTPEHMKRLATKLMKKYPVLLEGVNMGGDAMGGGGVWGQYGFDPYGSSGYGYDMWGAVNYYAGWDAPVAFPPFGYPVPKGGKGGKARNNRASSQGKRASKPAAGGKKGAASSPEDVAATIGTSFVDADGTKRVGRIVGFWPNYTITYDEAPVAAGSGSRGKHSKGVKSKAVAKAKQTP